MITAYGTVENAVSAMQAGAANFIQKPWDNEKLLADMRAAIARHRAEEENIQLKRALKQRYNFENIVGKSEPMLQDFRPGGAGAPSRSTVLLQGESGTGKELIAKAIHLNSPRRDKPFVPSIPARCRRPAGIHALRPREGRVHQRIASKKGLFEVADGARCSWTRSPPWAWTRRPRFCACCRTGALCTWAACRRSRWMCGFLPPPMSICARKCARARFREDLFYRLNVITVDLPPLRQRREDIPLLAQHFLDCYANENGLQARALQ